MKRTVLALFALASLSGLLSVAAGHADGLIMARWGRNRPVINEPEQKAVVLFSKGKEDLIISPSYEGPATDFAWVVPVPSRPKVSIVKGALFHELEQITEPPHNAANPSDIECAIKSSVVVVERRTIGAYDVSVLETNDGTALMKWLKTNGYHLPEKALKPIAHYVGQKWTFVASRIKMPGVAKGLRTGTLAPLKLSFAAERPVYPMRLSSANPKTFRALIYLLLSTAEIDGITVVRVAGRIRTTGGYPHHERPRRVEALGEAIVVKPQTRRHLLGARLYPTLSQLSTDTLSVFTYDLSMRPQQCSDDIVWQLPRK